LALVDILSQLEPFGREFESPIFECEAILRQLCFIGDGTHARVLLEIEGMRLKGVWFKLRQTTQSVVSVNVGDTVKVAFSVKANTFRNERTLDIHVVHMHLYP
ncbi:MAG TPA: single-stranded DNA exonuclease, partial [Gammaproteobacteria bacterium]|nr:single-stranded DNA exonuclease [Gammaproteobacteria bacterium]